MNLTLYAVNAFIVLDTDGHRVLAKYYSPKGQTQLGNPDPNKGLHTLKEQRAFEKGLFSKTKKPGGASYAELSRLGFAFIFIYMRRLRRYHSIRWSSSGVQTLSRPRFLRPWGTAGERTDATHGVVHVYRGDQSAPAEPGREADCAGELGLRHSLSGRDDRRWVRRVFVFSNFCLFIYCVYRIIVETDSTTIASRVSRPRADSTEIVINEQTLLNAYQTVKEKMQQRIGQL